MKIFLHEHPALTDPVKPLCCFCPNQPEYDMRGEAIGVSSFVRYFPEGKRGDTHVAFVQGIIGGAVSIFLIGRRETIPVTVEECMLISPIEVTGGLVGLIAHNKKFGAGEIIDEERIDNLLYVKLFGNEGKTSELIPITEVSLCCACC